MAGELTIRELAQVLQGYYSAHQAICHRQNDKAGYVFEDGVISAFEPIKVNVKFEREDAGYSNLAGAITLSDLLSADPDKKVLSLFTDANRDSNRTLDGVEIGVLTPFFADSTDVNGAWLDKGNAGVNNPTSLTLLPGDSSIFYLATGYGHNPTKRKDYLFSIKEVGSLKTGTLPPVRSYIKVTDLGNGEYKVEWEDLTGGGDRDFDDVRLRFSIERIPYYKRIASVSIPKTATANNTYAVQVGNVVVEAWYGTNSEETPVLWFKSTALRDLPKGYTIEVLDQNGNPYPHVGSNPYQLPSLKEGESDIQYFAPVDPSTGLATLRIVASAPATASLEKRAIIGYSMKTVTFGDEKLATFQIPVLDIVEKVELTFGKYERAMPNGKTLLVTVPATVESQSTAPTVQPITETIEITNPGKPVRPKKSEFIDANGKLDREAYRVAMKKYREDLATYKAALKEYKAAVRAAKLEAKGQTKSLRVEKKAIRLVNRALTKLIRGERKADRYITKAEITLQKAADYRKHAEELKAEADKRAAALLGEGWTMEDLKAKLVKPKKGDFADKEAYRAALAEYKEAKAIAKLLKKADKYEIKADKLEARAELYQQKALEVTDKSVDKFKSTLGSLIARYTAKADSLKVAGEKLLTQAQNLNEADYYKALGKGIYDVELAEGYARGAEIATAVLETYVNVDVSINPEVATSLDSVDISNVNVSI